MNAVDIIIVIACVALVVGVVVTSIVNRKKGKTSCGCDCSKCTCCSHSQVPKNEKEKNTPNK